MNSLLWLILFILSAKYILNIIVEILNIKSISPDIPREFKGHYDKDKYQKSQMYLRDNTRFGLIEETVQFVLLLLFILLGGFNIVDLWVRQWGFSEIINGLIYIFILIGLLFIIGLPFNIYDTFVIEEKYGFNKTTKKTFVLDIIKSLFLLISIGGPVLALILWFFEETGRMAPLYIWIFILLFQLFMAFVSPVLIMPLFNKFIPLKEGELKDRIEAYTEREKFKMKGIYTMDGSKRSSKSNAFFTGFGRFKRIVLFDTLIKSNTTSGLLTILAHEMGHFKLKHICKLLVSSIMETGLLLFLLSLFIKNEILFSAFFMDNISVYGSLVFFGFIYIPISMFLAMVTNYFSRKMERSADEFAVKTTNNKDDFINALKKLSVDNLSNLKPHKLKVFLLYSHPPILSRIKAIKEIDIGS